MIQISADIKSIERELSALSAAKTVAPRHAKSAVSAETGSKEQAKSRSDMPLTEDHLDSNFDAGPIKGLKEIRKNLLSSYFSETTQAIPGEHQSGLSTQGGAMFLKKKVGF